MTKIKQSSSTDLYSGLEQTSNLQIFRQVGHYKVSENNKNISLLKNNISLYNLLHFFFRLFKGSKIRLVLNVPAGHGGGTDAAAEVLGPLPRTVALQVFHRPAEDAAAALGIQACAHHTFAIERLRKSNL